MSFIAGLFWGLVIAGAFIGLEHYGSEIPALGPFSFGGNGALVAPEFGVPLAIFWGWSWIANRWSGRSIVPTVIYTIGLALGTGAVSPIDAVLFPSNPNATFVNSLPGLLGNGALFVLVPAAIAAAIFAPLVSETLPTNFFTLAVGYLIGIPFAFVFPLVTMGTVGGTAAAHAWRSNAQFRVGILVIIVMAIAILGIPYLLTSGIPRLPSP